MKHSQEDKLLSHKASESSNNECCWSGSFRHWITLLIGFQMMLVAGTLYSFSAFANAIKAQLNLTDNQATLIVTIGNFGLCFAPPSGYFVDYFGPKLTAFIGGILAVIGFIPFWFVVDDDINIFGLNKNINPIWLYIFYFIVGQGSIFTYCAAIKTYQNFSEDHQGKIIGILDCAFGLSAFVFALIYNIAFNRGQSDTKQNLSGFLFFLTVIMAISNLLGVFFIKLDNKQVIQKKSENNQNITVQNNTKDSIISHKAQENKWNILLNLDFILLFISMLMIQASGLLYMNNISYICKALHKDSYTAALTVLLPLSSAISRFCIGFLSDLLHPKYSRAFLFVIVTVIMFISQLLTTVIMDQLFLSAILVGGSFGCSWCLCPLMVSEQFGRDNFGLNWGIVIMASAFGGLMYQPLQTKVYNDHMDGSTDNNCYGKDCYQITFLVSTIGMIVAIVINIYLATRFKSQKEEQDEIEPDSLTKVILACD